MSHVPPSAAPAARPVGLGGPLAVIFWCACAITALPIAGLFSMIANFGVTGTLSALGDSLAGDALPLQVLRISLYPQAALFIWAAGMVILTVARSQLALGWGPWGLAAWTVVSIWAQFAIREAITPGGTGIADFAALVPGILMQVTCVAALLGYFREGARPRAFYTR